MDILTAVQMMQVISGTETIPVARPQWNDLVEIKRLLDGGCVRGGDSLGKHEGGGGAGGGGVPLSAGWAAGDGAVPGGAVRGADYAEQANAEIACVIQIETIGAVERIDEILSVPGVDGTLIGPADLATSLGIPVRPDNPHPDHVAACAEVLAWCQRNGVPGGSSRRDGGVGAAGGGGVAFHLDRDGYAVERAGRGAGRVVELMAGPDDGRARGLDGGAISRRRCWRVPDSRLG